MEIICLSGRNCMENLLNPVATRNIFFSVLSHISQNRLYNQIDSWSSIPDRSSIFLHIAVFRLAVGSSNL
jgi:hypothetical protein